MPKLSKFRTKFKYLTKKRILLGLSAIVAVLAVLEITNTTHLFDKSSVPPVIPTTNESTTIPSDNQEDGSKQDNSSDKAAGSTTNPDSSSNNNSLLQSPYGNFVSNHGPGMGGAPTSEVSVCNTTPGATCYIRFTKGSESTSLPAKKTNGDGAATWYWDTKEAKLSSGVWKITAIATLNGETKTAQDPLPLNIQ